ncbi:MAG TPA: hypothetical protein VLV86_22615 [Vicinamibacterales bacterium]|nr:hypothetical protein [Vicinamibacterales bacterium]
MFARRAALVLFFSTVSSIAHSQEWTSTDVGAVGVPGSATNAGASWTVRGSGGDIWGNADAFQFVHRLTNTSGFAIVRVDDLQASQPFAKAGVMIRASLDPQAATAILDVKPDGGLEFMARQASGAAMQFVDGTPSTSFAAVWLRLGWTNGEITAWRSSDGVQWTVLCTTTVALPMTPEIGLAVTSHDNGALATATFDNLSVGIQAAGWIATAVGDATSGNASEQNGTWTITGAGSDIWGAADSFEFLYRRVAGNNLQLTARIDDLLNTNPFAKAGLMVRASPDAGAAAVILDVTPGGHIELMARPTTSGEMAYLDGATVTTPAWLRLSWSADTASTTQVVAAISEDRVTWTPVGWPVALTLPATYDAGAAVTSHDSSRQTTAHVDGLSLLPSGWRSDDIGVTTPIGNASIDAQSADTIVTVEGAGGDIWSNADSFQFVEMPPLPNGASLAYRVVSLDNTNAFAKAGVMFRDGLDPSAPSVVLDAKPDGGVEFMARLCGGCATTFLGSSQLVSPAFLSLTRDGATFTARVFAADPSDGEMIGTVTVPMTTPTPGFAVTSHDAARTTTAIFDDPAR